MSNLIIYHKNCFDGFTALWVAAKSLGKDGMGGGMWPSLYGDPEPPDDMIQDRDVYIVDFSYPRDTLIRWSKIARKIQVLDHHKTAQANCEGLPFCLFDMNHSGAGLAWDYFTHDPDELEQLPMPPLVQYVQDRDLWKFELPASKAINAWIASYPMDLDVYDYLHKTLLENPDVAIAEGQAILRFETQKVEEICKEVRFVEVGEYTVPAVNCPYNFGSLCGERLCNLYGDYPFSAYYFDRGDGEQQWGLRSKGFDVSEVAKSLGGGGHKQASGFIKGKVSR